MAAADLFGQQAAIVSAPPPGEKAIIILTGPCGFQSCACAPVAAESASTAAAVPIHANVIQLSSLSMNGACYLRGPARAWHPETRS